MKRGKGLSRLNVKTVVIKESDWLRGSETRTSYERFRVNPSLLESVDGRNMKCCMGFVLEQLAPHVSGSIRGIAYPSDVEDLPFELDFFVSQCEKSLIDGGVIHPVEETLAQLNDKPIKHETRKNQICKIFRKHGIEIQFVP